MVQVMHAVLGGVVRSLTLPDPDDLLLPGIRWGAFDELLTPAFWRGQLWQHNILGTYQNFRLGRTLSEELSACLLGGYGMPAEMGLAAYQRLRDENLLSARTTVEELEAALTAPISVKGRSRRYRFPRQKARHLAACLRALEEMSEPEGDVELREVLVMLPGIGPKTASWIVRNYRGSNHVAIIDIHILRAGRHIELFHHDWEPQRHYSRLEGAFLQFAAALDVSAALLDSIMWDAMRRWPLLQTPTSVVRGDQYELEGGAGQISGKGDPSVTN